MAQWLRLHAPNAGGLGLIPGQGTRSHMHATTKEPAWCNQINKLISFLKIHEFLRSHLNIEDRRKKATFSAYYALLFQER